MIEVRRAGADGKIAVVAMNRPAQRNALNGGIVGEMTRALEKLRDDVSCRVVVVTGNGGFFSAGADLADFAAFETETDHNRTLRALRAGGYLCHVLENMPQITIAAIEGGAVGGGLGLAVSCDWRVMAADAFVYVPEVKLGLNYGWNTLPRLTRLVGPSRTKTMSILCRKHGAAECSGWGLADIISEPGAALDRAMTLAEETAGLPRMAAQTVKRQVNSYATSLGENVSFADMELALMCFNDAEGKEARASFSKSRGKGSRS